ncbi:cyclic nucleotide-binding domain-containing protein [Pseudomonadota bacterium]
MLFEDLGLLFFTVLALTLLFTPLSMRAAFYIGAIDQPVTRSVHLNPMPRLGGLGMVFSLLKGSVKISYYASDGREVVLSLLQEGSIFGEMALLDKQPRSATVSTLEDSRLAQIRQADFERLLLDQPQIALKLLAEVVSRLRRTSMVLERISTMDVPHRLYDYIQDYCLRFGEKDEDGYCAVKLQTHQLIADQLSTSRETISRAISALKKEKILLPATGRGEVRVDLNAIETLLFAIQ